MNKLLRYLGLLSCPLFAQPSGMEVVSGSAQQTRPSMGVVQIQATDRAIIQWDSFSIGLHETTRFALPDAASAVLNRVTGSQMSELMGGLQSNGQVFLINPHGVLVGPNATVDTAGFIASTFDVLSEDFLAKADLLFQGDSAASIVNLGTISTKGGDVMLLARHVDNQGSIEAPGGAVICAAGSQILLRPSESMRVFVLAGEHGVKEETGVKNSGRIAALVAELQADGNAYRHAICHTGVIEASGVQEQNGRILLVAEGGRIDITGQLKATAAEQIASVPAVDPESVYGEIRVLGHEIYALEDAVFDVSNNKGGGLIKIGYDLPGHNAKSKGMITESQVTLHADALQAGAGGRVMLWGTDANIFRSTITARGGPISGDGGFIEVSARGLLVPEGLIDTTAPNGAFGTLLLDPTDIVIGVADMNVNTRFVSPDTIGYIILIAGNPTSINATTLENFLTFANVIISTADGFTVGNGDINVNTAVSFPSVGTPTTTLNLFANRDINVNANISATGACNVSMIAARDVNISNSTISSTGGSISVLANRGIFINALLSAAAIQSISGPITVTSTAYYDNTSTIKLSAGSPGFTSQILSTAGGNITVNSAGVLKIVGSAAAAQISAGGTGTLTVNTGFDAQHVTQLPGDLLIQAGSAAGGAASITSGSGALTVNVYGSSASLGLQIVGSQMAVTAQARIFSTGGAVIAVSVDGPLTILEQADQGFCGITNNLSGPVSVTVNADTTFTAGVGAGGCGIITNGSVQATLLGNLTMTAGTTSGSAINSNSIGLSVGGNCVLTVPNGTVGAPTSQILAQTGLTMSVGGNLSLLSLVTGTEVGQSIIAGVTGMMNIQVTGSTILTGGQSAAFSFVGIQNGGTLNLICGGDLILTGGIGLSWAQIGTPNLNTNIPLGGPINVTANNILLIAGVNTAGNICGAWIGHGRTNAATSTQTAPITVNANNSIFMSGGTGTVGSIAQIGHVTSAGTSGLNTPITGNIQVTAGQSISLAGGTSVANNNATIGHGFNEVPTQYAYTNFTIQVIAGLNVAMTSAGSAGAGQAQIINRSPLQTSAITIVVDNNSPTSPSYGAGYFSLGLDSIVQSGPLATPNTMAEVRVYSSVRIFNSTALNIFGAGLINGLATPPASTLGNNTDTQRWNVYFNPMVPGGGGVYPNPNSGYVIYYKRIGGVLISPFGTQGGAFDGGGNFVFNVGAEEVYIADAAVTVQLSLTNTAINADLILSAVPNTMLLFQTPSIDWTMAHTLTLNAGNDLAIQKVINDHGPSPGGIFLSAGRDVIIGSGAAPNDSILETSIGNNPISVTTGRDVQLLASCSPVGSFIARITSDVGDIAVTVGRDLNLLASQGFAEITATSAANSTVMVGRNCTQQGGSGNLTGFTFLQTVTGQLTIDIGGLHTVMGGSSNNSLAAVIGSHVVTYSTGTGLFDPRGLMMLGGTVENALFQYNINSDSTLTVANGDLIMNGGAGLSTQIELMGSAGLTIAVPNGNLIMTGSNGTSGAALPMPGAGNNGDVRILSIITGALTLNIGGDLIMQAGSGQYCTAFITSNSDAPISITTGGDVILNAGSNNGTSIGSGGSVGIATAGAAGLLSLNIGGSLNMNASIPLFPNFLGGNLQDFAIISSAAANLVATVGGNCLLTGGSNSSQSAQIIANQTLDLTVGGDCLLTAGDGYQSFAILSVTQQQLNLQVGGNFTATAGAIGSQAVAGITSFASAFTPAYNIFSIGGNLTLNGNGYNGALIGNSGPGAGNMNTSPISITNVQGNITLNGATNASIMPTQALNVVSPTTPSFSSIPPNGGFAIIGNLNHLQGGVAAGGDILIACNGSITLNGGSTASSVFSVVSPIANAQNTAQFSFAQIGAGGQDPMSMFLNSNVTVISIDGNLTLNSSQGLAKIAAFGNGALMTNIGGNTTLNGASSITSQLGPITLLTGISQIFNDSSSVSNASPSGLSIVADNLFPTPPAFGLGRLMFGPNTTITSPGPTRLYSVAQQINSVLGLINGKHFTPGPLNVDSSTEQWFKYYPQVFGGFPFTFFYKTSFEGSSGGIETALAANATLDQFFPLSVPVIRVWEIKDEAQHEGEDEMQFEEESSQK